MKIAGVLAVMAVPVALVWGSYSLGSSHKQTEMELVIAAQKLANEREVARLKDEYGTKEATARLEKKEIENALTRATAAFEADLAALRVDYDKRLLLSSQRAGVYQRLAEGGTAERTSLASYAARLDSSLEEGRSLVRELRTTLGQRDRQIEALSDQIRSDRKLFTQQPEVSNGTP
jgi:hypothetical protein